MRVLFTNELAVVGGGYSEGDDFDPMGGGMGSYGSGGVSDYGIGIWDTVKGIFTGKGPSTTVTYTSPTNSSTTTQTVGQTSTGTYTITQVVTASASATWVVTGSLGGGK